MRSLLVGASVFAAAVRAVRVDEDEELVSTNEGASVESKLTARATGGATSFKVLMDKTIQRKDMANQNAAKAKIDRAAKAAKQATIAGERQEEFAEEAMKAFEKAKKNIAIAQVEIEKATTLAAQKKREEDEEWRRAELAAARQREAENAVTMVDGPNGPVAKPTPRRADAEAAAAEKLKAEQLAHAAWSAFRKAKSQFQHYGVEKKRAEEEVTKAKEEADAHKAAAEKKADEATLQKKAGEYAKERATMETEITTVKHDLEHAEAKLNMEKNAYGEALQKNSYGEMDDVRKYGEAMFTRHGEGRYGEAMAKDLYGAAMVAGKLATAKKATEETKKFEDEVKSLKDKKEALDKEAEEKEKERSNAEFEANKKAQEAREVHAVYLRERAEAAVKWETTRAQDARARAQGAASLAVRHHDTGGNFSNADVAASAEAQRAAAQAAYHAKAAEALAEGVKERKKAEAATKEKHSASRSAFQHGQLELSARLKADDEEALEAVSLGNGKKVEADAADAAAKRYKQEEAFQSAHRKKAQESAIKYEMAEEEHTKNAEEFERKADLINAEEGDMPCANEHGVCVCKGTVIYGQRFKENSTGEVRSLQATLADAVRQRPCGSSLICSDVVFGDPAPGQAKHCFCRQDAASNHAEDLADDAAKLARTAMKMARLSERTFYKDQLILDRTLDREQELGELTVAEADEANRQLLKKVQRMENEQARIKVEHGVGEVGWEQMDHHDMLG